jgi:diguanylate cyclase (GGDEF)-like protein
VSRRRFWNGFGFLFRALHRGMAFDNPGSTHEFRHASTTTLRRRQRFDAIASLLHRPRRTHWCVDLPVDESSTDRHGVPLRGGVGKRRGGARMTRRSAFGSERRRRLASWACGGILARTRETPEVRRAMLLTLREPMDVTSMALFRTQAAALATWIADRLPRRRGVPLAGIPRLCGLLHPQSVGRVVRRAAGVAAAGSRGRGLAHAGRGVAFHALLRLNHRIIVTALRAQQENRRLSMHDPLTELPNRLMLRERLAHLCRSSSREVSRPGFAVMCLDLDGFKDINDRLSHAAGDWLLKSVAERLVVAARPGDLICRVGGDEFVVVLPDIGDDDAIATAERFIDAVVQPHDLDGLSSTPVGVSIGIAMASGPGGDGDRLLAAADAALYQAKRAGKGKWELHRA